MTDGPGDLAPEQLAAYFALMETSSLLQYAVDKQLRADGGLSWVQFQILAGLGDQPDGRQRMTDIADRVVYSRSGLTYQARELEKAGHVQRSPDPVDERGTVVTITPQGRRVVATVMPGHLATARRMLLDALGPANTAELTRILGEVRDLIRSRPPRSAAPRASRASKSANTRG